MKQSFALVLVVLLAALVGARAQGLDDQYVSIFNLIQQADSLSSNRPSNALTKYAEAQAALQRFQKGNPDWNTAIVKFRLNYIASQIASLSARLPVPSAPDTAATNPPSATAAAAAPPKPAPPSDWENQLNSLKNQLRQLQTDKALLEAKLKEALSMQPAAVDPHELAQAEERVKSLEKENALLKVTLNNQKSKPAPAPDTAALDQARQALDQARQALAQTRLQLSAQKELAAKTVQERDALQTRLKNINNVDAETLAALRAENQLLKKRLAGRTAAPAAAQPETVRQLAQAQAQIATLQSDKELLHLEKVALQNRVKQLMATANARGNTVLSAAPSAEEAARIKQLERERDDLRKKLDAANKVLYGRKGKKIGASVEELQNELATVRARLEVLEAKKVPYSAEELALFKQPENKLPSSEATTGRGSVRELSPGSAKLVAEARAYFSAGQFDKAEQTYAQVVERDQKSPPALTDMANIEIEANHLKAAESSIQRALALAPDNAYSLTVLGHLRYKQGKYDDALDALSRAARFDPKNAEIQNYLGLILSQKGLRSQAETAFRKAIELQPNYASAHNNLAVFYITQKPPFTALARWHYQRALDAGHPRNPELEKLLGIQK